MRSRSGRTTVVSFRSGSGHTLGAVLSGHQARDSTEAGLVMDATQGPVPAGQAAAARAKQSGASAIRVKLENVPELHDPPLIR